jgi:hypothetical protein
MNHLLRMYVLKNVTAAFATCIQMAPQALQLSTISKSSIEQYIYTDYFSFVQMIHCRKIKEL